MIVFDLKCGAGHVFEAWFGKSGDYEDQARRGLIECPLCGDKRVEKAVMAPAVSAKGNRAPAGAPDPAAVKQMLAGMAAAQRELLERSSWVGTRFADEARAIHLGEADARAIHGKATRAEAEQLADEGIPVSPLPFPVAEPGEEN
jgi:hypothetical protein